MLTQKEVISAISKLADWCAIPNDQLNAAISKTYLYNNWLTTSNYKKALNNWLPLLTKAKLTAFSQEYSFTEQPKKVGIIMAGNIPMVGFHDLLCVLLSGNIAVIKPSSDDKDVIPLLMQNLIEIEPRLKSQIEITERLEKIDAVIATGSNNSFRYFEYYFKHIPSILRKNRKSVAILNGDETVEQLALLGDDVFSYYGLGCRNLSLIFVPKGFEITKLLDQFMSFSEHGNHNKYANNYTYHRALLLMNNAKHLDTGFALFQEKQDLNAPLSIVYYCYYERIEEVSTFINSEEENIQCIVGKNFNNNYTAFGDAQKPDLQDFADGLDTLKFLNKLND